MTLHQRIGQGIDFHRLEEGRELWLGGVHINSPRGCVAHSDGDVLIHAICDGLFGAAGLNDIGYHFPDTSDEFRGIDSKILLKRTVEMITEKGYRIVNIDSTVCLEAPRLAPYITAMRNTLAAVAGISPDAVSVKATTTEKMGFTGRGEGIVALAVCLLSDMIPDNI
ncbi:MAG: 2-C-methyl-D-erythritol 2,4-cyclodiphosphate synthase [Bacteroidales bacterium]|jgi:2-C-methyl-D-erythritol 2,4-cyclodiphosphate synthase|nr:2-C-methyl-D-erythritol 2,4-cyclodiphosphate synthase [Bacteroidales bacterium]MDD3735572.1 2-C-methyl-D-erythritol 2,4-cyclodiphosphate synthase [Bacteroidales bacterium]NLD63249.1 2-C-methyl-D-erythritol 2,4-cyclodiphosphate synthase [Bacteroidales bacterium]HNT93789.1 2-C-methyl-D-erythritol 2,4-cyclodiphosphate synthase [Bacteroidales bacterium]HRW26132.1 2-C-methyl-D-erythritol 2,4-cyclodiphosphate synthase [Bacteroidales bacterium]